MNTADLAIIAGTIVELATVGTVGVLVFTKRILLAATPKPQSPQGRESKVTKQPPAAGDAKTGPVPLERAS